MRKAIAEGIGNRKDLTIRRYLTGCISCNRRISQSQQL